MRVAIFCANAPTAMSFLFLQFGNWVWIRISFDTGVALGESLDQRVQEIFGFTEGVRVRFLLLVSRGPVDPDVAFFKKRAREVRLAIAVAPEMSIRGLRFLDKSLDNLSKTASRPSRSASLPGWLV